MENRQQVIQEIGYHQQDVQTELEDTKALLDLAISRANHQERLERLEAKEELHKEDERQRKEADSVSKLVLQHPQPTGPTSPPLIPTPATSW
eukprot:FR735706.1.p2 GENE.FR735706.1~~FR735706.1.p2  ORF type:complete len:102 (+),score=0.50 FR735706.1:31-306(+)